MKILCLTLLFSQTAEIISAENFYFSLFLSKEADLKKQLLSNNPNISLYIDKFKYDIIQNISNDTYISYKLVSEFEIFKNEVSLNFTNKKKLLKKYSGFKNIMFSEFFKTGQSGNYLKSLIDNCFSEFKKLHIKNDALLFSFKLDEFNKFINLFKENPELKKINEPRVQFMSDYLIYINDKMHAAFADRDIKSFSAAASEMQAVYEYIINRVNLKL